MVQVSKYERDRGGLVGRQARPGQGHAAALGAGRPWQGQAVDPRQEQAAALEAGGASQGQAVDPRLQDLPVWQSRDEHVGLNWN